MLTYQQYNDTKFLVVPATQEERVQYHHILKRIKARWNSRAKPHPGWLVPIEYEEVLKNILQQEGKVPQPKHRRPSQLTLHRSHSTTIRGDGPKSPPPEYQKYKGWLEYESSDTEEEESYSSTRSSVSTEPNQTPDQKSPTALVESINKVAQSLTTLTD